MFSATSRNSGLVRPLGVRQNAPVLALPIVEIPSVLSVWVWKLRNYCMFLDGEQILRLECNVCQVRLRVLCSRVSENVANWLIYSFDEHISECKYIINISFPARLCNRINRTFCVVKLTCCTCCNMVILNSAKAWSVASFSNKKLTASLHNRKSLWDRLLTKYARSSSAI